MIRALRTAVRTAPAFGRAAAVLALLAAAVCGGMTVGAAPAAAAARPMSACTSTTGVVVAVDFSRWGGPLLRSCGTTPTTGYALLNQGGWQTTGTQHDGPAFICRIGYAGYQGGTQYPTSKNEACVLTPPATAYWSYWHADPGKNTWSYSQLGAMSYHPKPGSVDLWIFGATNITGTQGRPAFPPDSVRAHNSAPGAPRTSQPAQHKAPTTKAPRRATTAPAEEPSPTVSGTTTAVTLTPSPSRTAAPGSAGSPPPPGSTAPPASTAPPGTASPGLPQMQDAAPTAAAGHSTGSVLPAALTAGVLAVIAAAVVLRARQRRNAK